MEYSMDVMQVAVMLQNQTWESMCACDVGSDYAAELDMAEYCVNVM